MAAMLCTNTAAALPHLPRRRVSPCDATLTAPVSAHLSLRRRRSLPTSGLRCAGAEGEVTEAGKGTVVVPFGQSPAVVGSVGDEAAASKAEKAVKGTAVVPFGQSPAAVGSVGDEQAASSKLGFKETATYVIYGTGAFFVGWLLSAVVSAIDTIPLLPRVLEMVGLGYTIWFSLRYLLFKDTRDELFAKAYDLQMRITGSGYR